VVFRVVAGKPNDFSKSQLKNAPDFTGDHVLDTCGGLMPSF